MPVINALDPAGSSSDGGWTLDIHGSGFAPGAQVLIDGSVVAATYVNSGQFTLSAPPLSPGIHAVQVLNAPGLASNSKDLAVEQDSGPLHVDEAVPMPNPVTGLPRPILFKVKLDGRASRIRVRIYGRAMAVAGEAEVPGQWLPGWNAVPVPLPDLGPGTWFFSIEAQEGERKSLRRPPGRLVVLR